MTAAQVIEKDVLIDSLLALEDPDNPGTFPIQDLVPLEGATGEYKVFWEHVEDDVELPYIVVSHMMGGRAQGTTTSQSYSDTTWKIALHTGDIGLAEDAANAIGLLRDTCPVVTSHSGVSPVTTIQELMPVFDRYQVQNVPLFVVGGLYRLRLNLGSN